MLVRYPTFTYELHHDVTDACLARAIVVEYGDDEFFIESVAVTEAFQGRGHGREIMGHLIREYGSVTLVLKVNAYGTERLDNSALEAWYKRLGFEWDEGHEYMRRPPNKLLDAPRPTR